MDPYLSLFPAAFLVAYVVIYVAILAVMIVSLWKIYEKMGEPGWKGIIPFYNIWVMIGKVKKPKSWFWIIVAVSLLLGGISITTTMLLFLAMQAREDVAGIVAVTGFVTLLLAVVVLVYQIRIYYAVSKSFGRGVGFTAGLILLPVVFMPILAFGDSAFTEPEDPKPAVPSESDIEEGK